MAALRPLAGLWIAYAILALWALAALPRGPLLRPDGFMSAITLLALLLTVAFGLLLSLAR